MWDERGSLERHDSELGNVSSDHSTWDAKGCDETRCCNHAYGDTGCVNSVKSLLLILRR